MHLLKSTFLKRPALFILFPYIFGLMVEVYLNVPQWLLISSILSLILILFIISLLKFRPYLLFSSIFIFFLIGLLFMEAALNPKIPPHHIRNLIDGNIWTIEGTLYRAPEILLDRMRVYVEVDEVIRNKRVKKATGRMLLTIGDRDIDLRYGDRIRFMTRPDRPKSLGNPGSFDYKRFLLSKGILAKGYVRGGRWVARLSQTRNLDFWRVLERARDHLREFIDKEVQVTESSLLKALLLGEKREIPKDIKELFIRTGTAHILAISGLHIGIVAFVSFWIIYKLLSLSERILLNFNIKKLSAFTAVIPVILYGFIGGFSLPTQRAVVMVLVFLFAIILDREKDLYNTLAVAALIILIAHPLSIFDVSFQLSFAAVISIIYLVPRLNSIWKKDTIEEFQLSKRLKIKNWILAFLLTSLAAFIGTSPIIIFHFHRISLLSFLANLFIVPLIGFVVVPLTLFAGIILFVYYNAAIPFIYLSAFVLKLSIKAAQLLSNIPYASIWVSTPSLLSVSLYYISILSLMEMRRRKWAIYILIVAASIFISYRFGDYVSKRTDQDLRATFISVGQGDSTLVEFPGGKTMLIDGGGIYSDDFDMGERVIAPLLWSKGIKKLDYLVLTHPQADHLKGLVFIAENFKIGEFWWNGDKGEFQEYRELLRVLDNKGIKKRILHRGYPPLYFQGVHIEPLHPPSDKEGLGTNDLSLVLRLLYKDFSLLLPGDIEKEGEDSLLRSGVDIRAVVVKVPHHGSTTSSTESFLEKIDSQIAVVSVGCGNPFGFPKKQVLDRYRSVGVRIYRTDIDGAVTVETDGKEVNVKTFYSPDKQRQCG